MGKIERIATIENEVVASKLEVFLRERDIPFSFRTFKDQAYDGIYETQKGWGILEAPQEFKDEILAILENIRDYDEDVIDTNHSEKKTNTSPLKIILLVIIGLFVSIGLFFFVKDYFYMKKIIHSSNTMKNYQSRWSGRIYITKYRSNLRTASKYFDQNGDLNFEKSELYSRDGHLVRENFDEDENGFYEKSYVYNEYGDLISEQYDLDEDYFYEKQIEYMDSGAKIIWIDNDYDDYYIPEICEVVYPNGEKKTFNIRDEILKIVNLDY